MLYPLRDNIDGYMKNKTIHLSLTVNNCRQSTTTFSKRQEKTDDLFLCAFNEQSDKFFYF